MWRERAHVRRRELDGGFYDLRGRGWRDCAWEIGEDRLTGLSCCAERKRGYTAVVYRSTLNRVSKLWAQIVGICMVSIRKPR